MKVTQKMTVIMAMGVKMPMTDNLVPQRKTEGKLIMCIFSYTFRPYL